VECRKKAIRLGCNVVDTSSIYSDGDSELLFGQVVRELVDKEDIKREVRLSSFSSFPSSFLRHSSSSLLVHHRHRHHDRHRR
jgi:predicted aldo/keto reductase-like oxidoreductase